MRLRHVQALGWLVMLMPTQQAARRDGDWDAWLRAWLRLWGQVYHSAFWNTLWLHLVARLAKHDTAGAQLTRRSCSKDMLTCSGWILARALAAGHGARLPLSALDRVCAEP